jgi:hypothetical protein
MRGKLLGSKFRHAASTKGKATEAIWADQQVIEQGLSESEEDSELVS